MVSVVCLSVMHMLWLTEHHKGSVMVLLDRAMTSSHVTMSLSLAVWLQFQVQSCCLHPFHDYLHKLLYLIAFDSIVNIVCVEL